MKVSVTTIPLADLDVDLLLVPTSEDALSEVRQTLGQAFGEVVTVASEDFDGSLGRSVLFYPAEGRAKRVALIGTGPGAGVTTEVLRRAAAAGAKVASGCKAETVAFRMPDTGLEAEQVSQALVEGFMLAAYRFTTYKTGHQDEGGRTQRLVFVSEAGDKSSRSGAERGRIIAEAVMSARDLVNLSPHEKTPTLFSKAVERAAKKWGYTADVWDKELIVDEGMGGLLAVNQGSVEPPTFTILTWQPENALNERPLVLVGKGVMFDTGGLSLKPTKGSMDHMKADMAGAAAVVGTFEALARLDIPLYVVGLIPATDNRPGETAYVPGDVVKMHAGKTVEVLNTDAEGRMILADALSYAKTYLPELVIDVATLTGAAVVALGKRVGAVLTPEGEGAEDRLQRMVQAGERSGDRVHPLPMFSDYAKQLESSVADMKNVGGREAGTVTAAKFLEHFVSYPWIHLDIAGPAFLDKAQPYAPVGGSGFGVRLLTEFLRTQADPRRRKG
ncbi:MAG: leucyl aminopeptidase [Bacteroidota bacterium]